MLELVEDHALARSTLKEEVLDLFQVQLAVLVYPDSRKARYWSTPIRERPSTTLSRNREYNSTPK